MKKGKMTVLVIEDQEINRFILQGILKKKYNVIEVVNGKEAFERLTQHDQISAILLDIDMPVMDGYTFLRKLKKTGFASLPVIAVTDEKDEDAEQKVLDLGAWDFVTRPYKPQILLSRLKNVIVRSQFYLVREMNYAYEHDTLTGLDNRSKFFEETRILLDSNKGKTFVLIRFDIDKFHLLNSFWGEAEGDRFLQFIADYLRHISREVQPCTIGRINADVFCICAPFDETSIADYVDDACRIVEGYNKNFLIKPSFGVYVIRDDSLDIQTMYEFATLAAKECKGRIITTLYYYKPELSEKIHREQEIVHEMQKALDEGQFVPYFQPKFNLKNETPYGAEALIRWKHPTKGMIMPGMFIPVFENNGFIGKVDFYMWEQVCKWLRKRIAAGKEVIPISVNVSRVNMYNPNLVTVLVDLIKKYDLDPGLLNLEITESAYMDNPGIMERTVLELQSEGFVIMMDDFGNGYSSLNTLKNIPVDILKIDIDFLSTSGDTGRSECILASIIRMAGWLEIPVVMEGVETLKQVEFLKSIGCGYVQGYYYARPMPEEEYDALIECVKQVPVESISENHKEMVDVLWSSGGAITLLFNSIIEPAAVYEFENDRFRTLRVNSRFIEFFGYGEAINDEFESAYEEVISEKEIMGITEAFNKVADTRDDTYCEFNRAQENGSVQKLRMYLKYWGKNETSSVIFATFLIL